MGGLPKRHLSATPRLNDAVRYKSSKRKHQSKIKVTDKLRMWKVKYTLNCKNKESSGKGENGIALKHDDEACWTALSIVPGNKPHKT